MNTKIAKKVVAISLVAMFTLLVGVNVVQAAVDIEIPTPPTDAKSGKSIWPSSWGTSGDANNPQAKDVINPIIGWVLAIIGLVCVIMVVYAGIKIATSGDKEEERKKGIKMLTWSLIGLVIVLAAYAIVAVIGGGLETAFR